MTEIINNLTWCVCAILFLSTCTTLAPQSFLPQKFLPHSKNSLACRYRTPDGHLLELKGLTAAGKEKFYPIERSGNTYLWSCSSAENKCPLFLNNDLSFLQSNLYFVVNDSRNDFIRTSFVDEAIQSCQNYTPHPNATFVEFGIKSLADAQPTAFHKPFFQRVHTNDTTPFGRIIAFGDSLTDNGNVFATTKQVAQWPYFIGRFANGPVWIENIANTLTLQQKIPVDLYNYAEGGSGTGFVAFNPFSLDRQVELYLSTMDNTCPEKAKGCAKNDWDPAYDKTLFVILSGANDYMYCAALDSKTRNQNCLCESASDCANVVINGRTQKNGTIKGIKNKILDIIEHAKQTNNQDAQYFLIPNLPDIALSPYYTKVLSKNHFQTKFVHEASLKHNRLLTDGIAEIQKIYPNVKFINLNLFKFIGDSINNLNSPIMQAARIKNTKDRCFFGNPTDFKSPYCTDPASYLFWDYIHPSMTAHCAISEYAISEIHSTFFQNSIYTPNYESCHNSYITH